MGFLVIRDYLVDFITSVKAIVLSVESKEDRGLNKTL